MSSGVICEEARLNYIEPPIKQQAKVTRGNYVVSPQDASTLDNTINYILQYVMFQISYTGKLFTFSSSKNNFLE